MFFISMSNEPWPILVFQSYYFDRDDHQLKNVSKFLKKQSDDEREHAMKLMEYQNMRGGRIVLRDIKVSGWHIRSLGWTIIGFFWIELLFFKLWKFIQNAFRSYTASSDFKCLKNITWWRRFLLLNDSERGPFASLLPSSLTKCDE